MEGYACQVDTITRKFAQPIKIDGKEYQARKGRKQEASLN